MQINGMLENRYSNNNSTQWHIILSFLSFLGNFVITQRTRAAISSIRSDHSLMPLSSAFAGLVFTMADFYWQISWISLPQGIMLQEVNTLKCHDLSLTRKNVTKENTLEVKDRDQGSQLMKTHLLHSNKIIGFYMEIQLALEWQVQNTYTGLSVDQSLVKEHLLLCYSGLSQVKQWTNGATLTLNWEQGNC